MTYIGTGFPYQLKPDVLDTRDGTIVISRWKVISTALDAWRATLTAAGYVEIDSQAMEGTPFHIVSARTTFETGTSVILSDVWSVAYNELQRSIWVLPIIKTQLATATAEQAALFRADVESLLAGNRTYTDSSGAEGTLTFAEQKAVAVAFGADPDVIDALFRSLGDGVDHQTVSLPVLRRRTILTENTTLEPAFENVGSVFTTSSLLNTYEPTIPANIANAVSTRFAGGYWLKKSPSADQQEDGRWLYGSEYWYIETATPDPLLFPVVL